MATPNAAVKITQLADIGANLANTNIVPVVGMGPGGVLTTQSTTIGNIANLIFSTGTVANAITAQSVTNAAQPNITSVGTLSSLTVSGNMLALNVNGGNSVRAIYLIGDGGNITGIQGAHVVGPVAQSITTVSVPGSNVVGAVSLATVATTANAAIVANTVSHATQPNITSVGTLSNLSVAGTVGISGDTGMIGNVTVTGPLDVNGNVTLDGNVTMNTPNPIEINGVATVMAAGTPISHRLPVVINGVTYYIALTTAP